MVTTNIYNPTGSKVTFDRTLDEVFGDDDFRIVYTFDNNTVIFTTQPPDFGSETIADQHYTSDVAITALQLPQATHGNGTLSYSVSPALPAGLNFDASTRQITGTPTASQSAKVYTYKAADMDGDEATLTFTITVVENTAPGFGGATIPEQVYAQNFAISTLQLPAAMVRPPIRSRPLFPPG